MRAGTTGFWIFYELLNIIIHRLSQDRTKNLRGIDTTSIKLDLPCPGIPLSDRHNREGDQGTSGSSARQIYNTSDSDGNSNECQLMSSMTCSQMLEADLQRVILVFDRGYWSLERFRDLTAHGIRFIIPLKSGVKYTAITKKKVWIWRQSSLPGIRLRLVLIRKGGKELFYVTNVQDLSPEDIHQCYEQRWDMEILNKDLKYNLKNDHFMGRNLNAVLIQIFATLIAYLLRALFRIFHNSLLSPGEVRRLLRYYGHKSLREVRRVNPMLCCG